MDAAVLHPVGKPPRCEQFPEPVASHKEVIVHVHVEQQQMHPQEAWSTGRVEGGSLIKRKGGQNWIIAAWIFGCILSGQRESDRATR